MCGFLFWEVTGGFPMINPWLVPHHGEVIDPHFHFFDLSDCSTSGQDPKVLSDFQVENKGEFGKIGRKLQEKNAAWEFFFGCKVYLCY